MSQSLTLDEELVVLLLLLDEYGKSVAGSVVLVDVWVEVVASGGGGALVAVDEAVVQAVVAEVLREINIYIKLLTFFINLQFNI